MVVQVNNPGGFSLSDDGTFLIASSGGVRQFKVRKSDGQLFIRGGLNDSEDPL